jgi:hypothetical protein
MFVLWYAAASDITRNDFIMPNHFVKKWASYFYTKHQKIKNERKN